MLHCTAIKHADVDLYWIPAEHQSSQILYQTVGTAKVLMLPVAVQYYQVLSVLILLDFERINCKEIGLLGMLQRFTKTYYTNMYTKIHRHMSILLREETCIRTNPEASMELCQPKESDCYLLHGLFRGW
eukprot:g42657.t1